MKHIIGVTFSIMLLTLALSNLVFGGEIHDAAGKGDLRKVKALLNDDPDLVSSKDNEYGGTPLHWAAAFGRMDVVKHLLANKADVNAKNKYGQTPLQWAELNDHKNMAEFLRQYDHQDSALNQATPNYGNASDKNIVDAYLDKLQAKVIEWEEKAASATFTSSDLAEMKQASADVPEEVKRLQAAEGWSQAQLVRYFDLWIIRFSKILDKNVTPRVRTVPSTDRSPPLSQTSPDWIKSMNKDVATELFNNLDAIQKEGEVFWSRHGDTIKKETYEFWQTHKKEIGSLAISLIGLWLQQRIESPPK